MDKDYADTASNRLYHGEVDDFYTALREMVQQYRDEARWIRTKYARLDPDDAAKGLAEMDRYITQIERCREEYTQALEAMEQALSDRWSDSMEEVPPMLAEALRTKDYSRLAL